MNQFLPSRFSESVKRLALGLEPIDAGQNLRVAQPVRITYDTAPLKLPRPSVDTHGSGLHVLLYSPAVASPVDLRIFDEERHFVPRRLSFPILTQTAAEANPPDRRVRRPVLFPGAAYDVTAATGVRGRVVRGGQPMRWARLEARLATGGRLVGRGHGDDRGEFLILIGSEATPVGDLDPPLHLNVTAFGPAAPPVPPDAGRPAIDPLWDLPLEQASAPGAPDPVTAGEVQPANYTASATVPVDLPFGRIASGLTIVIP